jgi:predicted Rossmann fold flavoprotein
MELHRLSVPLELNFDCTSLAFSGSGITLSSRSGAQIECHKVIITGGGKAYPALGSDGSTLELAHRLGHTLLEPVPAAVPLVVKDSLCQLLQGQRISAAARSVVDGQLGQEARGELLFTQYGLSGTCILDVSEDISLALHRHKKSGVMVSVDLIPFLDKTALEDELKRRQQRHWLPEEMLIGLLPNKLCSAFKGLFVGQSLSEAVASLKDRRFKVAGTRGWNEAEFTAGGINVNEINPRTLESRIRPGVYLAGEVLDVNGKRGGYNLAWAWASGFVAGQTG